jgi:hypothetical protein
MLVLCRVPTVASDSVYESLANLALGSVVLYFVSDFLCVCLYYYCKDGSHKLNG